MNSGASITYLGLSNDRNDGLDEEDKEVCKNTVNVFLTLESGMDIGQGINVGPGKFGKKNKKSNLEISIAYGKIPKK